MRRLALEQPERRQLTLGVDDTEHGINAEAAYEFVLKISTANLESEFVQGARAESGPAQRAGNATGLALVAQPKEPVVCAGRAVNIEVTDDAGGASHGDHRYMRRVQVISATAREHLDREPVAFAFDQDSRRLH